MSMSSRSPLFPWHTSEATAMLNQWQIDELRARDRNFRRLRDARRAYYRRRNGEAVLRYPVQGYNVGDVGDEPMTTDEYIAQADALEAASRENESWWDWGTRKAADAYDAAEDTASNAYKVVTTPVRNVQEGYQAAQDGYEAAKKETQEVTDQLTKAAKAVAILATGVLVVGTVAGGAYLLGGRKK